MKLDKPFYLCSDCSKDIYLKNYIQQHSKSKNSCTICQQDKLTIDISAKAGRIDHIWPGKLLLSYITN